MSDISHEPKNFNPKKARLGRGIGSLLGGNMDPGLTDGLNFEESRPAVEKPVQAVEKQPTSRPEVQATPPKDQMLGALTTDIPAQKPEAPKEEPRKAARVVGRITNFDPSLRRAPEKPSIAESIADSLATITETMQTTPAQAEVEKELKAEPVEEIKAVEKAKPVEDIKPAETIQVASEKVDEPVVEAVAVDAQPEPLVEATKVEVQLDEPKVEAPPEAPQQSVEGYAASDLHRVWNVEVHKLQVNPHQPRKNFSKEHLADLATSIKEKGILQPITARRLEGNELEIIAGERRWRAAQLAGLHQVPVIIKEVSNQDSLELALIENIQRQELNAIEEALAYQRLASDFNMTQAEISQKVGKDRVTIANTLRLLNLIPEVQQLVIDGRLSMGHARALLQVTDSKRQLAIAKQVVEGGLSVRATEKLATQAAKSPEEVTTQDPKVALAGRLIKGMTEDLQKRIGSRVSIDYNSGKGKLAVYFYSDDELNQMVERIKDAWQK